VSRGKHVLAAFAIAAAVFAGAGCGSDAEDSQNGAARESTYPDKPIEIVSPAEPGGGSDTFARLLVDYLESKGVEATVVNKPGAGTITGARYVLRKEPDGYTLLTANISTNSIIPATQADAPFAWDDFSFLPRLTVSPLVLTVNADSEYETAEDLMTAISADPGKFSFATAGRGVLSTFQVAKLLDERGVDFNKIRLVTFPRGAPVMTALAGGPVDFAAQGLGEAIQLIKAGKLKPLAVSGEERVEDLPDVPTASEAGIEGFGDGIFVYGLVGPAGLPDDVVAFWDKTMAEAAEDPKLTDDVARSGNFMGYMPSAEFRTWTQQQHDKAKTLSEQFDLSAE
jgi:tripartite-type tricarboxylate transporter receptor subunit TctC